MRVRPFRRTWCTIGSAFSPTATRCELSPGAGSACIPYRISRVVPGIMALSPEPSHNWDAQRRAREIERGLARLRWMESEQRKTEGGFWGVWNWLIGKPKLTVKLLYDRMIENADGMLAAMNEDRYDDIIHDVTRFTGVDP